jgi:hypothetical protein
MFPRPRFTALLATSLLLAACSSDNVLGLGGGGADTSTKAKVRIANATATDLDVVTGTAVAAGNGALGFGEASSCIVTTPATPDLAITQAGTSTSVTPFDVTLQAGRSYTVVAYRDVLGATRLLSVTNQFIPGSGQAGLAVANADATLGGTYDVYVTASGPLAGIAPTVASVAPGTTSGFVDVDASATRQVRLTSAGSTVVLVDVGTVAFVPGQITTLVIGSTVGDVAPRAFLVAGC